MYKVSIYITLKTGVLDPQGSEVTRALQSLDYTDVEEVRMGKYIEVMLQKTEDPIDERVRGMCERLLANPVTEDYRYEVEEVVGQ